jgi:hypothetical protein
MGMDLRGRTKVDKEHWSGEGDSGEIESKGGFEEHHGASSRSKRLGWTEKYGVIR